MTLKMFRNYVALLYAFHLRHIKCTMVTLIGLLKDSDFLEQYTFRECQVHITKLTANLPGLRNVSIVMQLKEISRK